MGVKAFILATTAVALSAALPAAADPPLSADPGIKPEAPFDPNRPLPAELGMTVADGFTLTAVGSLIISNPSGPLPPFDGDILQLLQTEGATLGNFESSVFNPGGFQGYPFSWDGAPVLRSDPEVAKSLKDSGFDMLARANEHALDWGIEGMRATSDSLDHAGLIHAGTGENQGLARGARYFEHPKGLGRIALVSFATTYRPTSDALHPEGAAPARPGVSAIELETYRLISRAQRDQLYVISCRFKYPRDESKCASLPPPPDSVTTLGSNFQAASDPSQSYTNTYELNYVAAQDVLHNIRQGKESADFLVAAMESEEPADIRSPDAPPADFLVKLAHAAIDAGADAFVATGIPRLGPIEIYWGSDNKGKPKPIFYGLGNFYWSPGLAPPDAPYSLHSVLAQSTYTGGRLVVYLYPLDLSGSPSGRPRFADKNTAMSILNRLRALSAPYGTDITSQAFGSTYRGYIMVEGQRRGRK